MAKKNKNFYLDEDIYKEFLIYSIMIDTSVSKLVEDFMRNTLNEVRKTTNKK